MDEHYLLYSYSSVTGFPIHVFDGNGKMHFPLDFTYKHDIFISQPSLAVELFRNRAPRTGIVTDSCSSSVAYGIFFSKGRMYVLGPCQIRELSFSENISFRKGHSLSDKFSLVEASNTLLFHAIQCLRFIINGQRTTIDQILRESGSEPYTGTASSHEITNYMLCKSENDVLHSSYAEDMMVLHPLTDIASPELGSSIVPAYLESISHLQKEGSHLLSYHEAGEITLAAHAAIEKGALPARAFNVRDLYMQKLELCREDNDIFRLNYAMMQDFARLTLEAQNSGDSNYIKRCKNYLLLHIHEKVRLADISKELGLNPNYLSSLFTKTEGVTITEFLCRERLKGAADMLKYSDSSYADIAGYFCFSSQSRFIEVFKRHYKVTPAVYRQCFQAAGRPGYFTT